MDPETEKKIIRDFLIDGVVYIKVTVEVWNPDELLYKRIRNITITKEEDKKETTKRRKNDTRRISRKRR